MSKFLLSLIILIVPLTSAAQLNSAQANDKPGPCRELAKGRPSVGVVLEGGVALGLAHVGVLRWLEENKIPVDCIAGTSMGGLIGALYSMGYSPQDFYEEQKQCARNPREDCPKNLEKFLKDLLDQDRWESVFFDLQDYGDLSFSRKGDRRTYPNSFKFRFNRSIHLPEGVVPGHRVGLVFDDLAWPYFPVESFDEFPIPFRCVATDLTRRRSDVLGASEVPGTNVFSTKVGAEGRLSEALRATMSLPVYFSPVEVTSADGTKRWSYVDGGLLQNLPVDALKDLGADVIIAVHLDERGKGKTTCADATSASGETKSADDRTFLDILSDTLSLVTFSNEQKSIKELAELKHQTGLCINVDVSGKGFTSTAFDKWSELIKRGYEAPKHTDGFVDATKHLALGEEQFKAYQALKNGRNKRFQRAAEPAYVTIATNLAAPPSAQDNAAIADNKDQRKKAEKARKEAEKQARKDKAMKEWLRRSLACSPIQEGYRCPRYVPGTFTETEADRLQKQLNKMVGTGRFSRLGYHMLTDESNPTKPHVAITALKADYTGAVVQPVLAVDGSDYQTPVFALGARFTAFDYGVAGSEWRGEAVLGSRYGVNTEYQMPLLGPASHWFIAPRATAESAPYNVYHDQDELARYQLRTISGALDMGYNFSSTAQLRVGYEGGGTKLSQKLGAAIFPFSSGRTGTTSLRFSLDLLSFSPKKLEAPVVPCDGVVLNSEFQWHDAWLGASDHFPSATTELEAFKSVNKKRSGSVYLKADGGSALGYFNNGLPLFSLGTPLHLAAYGTNELRTNQYAYGSAGYIHRVYPFQGLGGAIYVTGFVEMAKVYGVPGAPVLPKDAGGGVILNSVVGPLFVGGTMGDAGHRKFFFYMGKVF